MIDNWKTLCEEYETHRGQLCIPHGLEVEKLVGLVELENDYYWDTVDFFGEHHYLSCVGTPIWLHGVIRDQDYRSLILSFTVHWVDDEDPKPLEKCNE